MIFDTLFFSFYESYSDKKSCPKIWATSHGWFWHENQKCAFQCPIEHYINIKGGNHLFYFLGHIFDSPAGTKHLLQVKFHLSNQPNRTFQPIPKTEFWWEIWIMTCTFNQQLESEFPENQVFYAKNVLHGILHGKDSIKLEN